MLYYTNKLIFWEKLAKPLPHTFHPAKLGNRQVKLATSASQLQIILLIYFTHD